MIKFFSKIRRNLLVKKKFTNYLLYAIGEIVLVVIGILIALSINNWNENRKSSQKEQNYLISLKEEFQYNKLMLENVMSQNKRYGDTALDILKYTGPDKPQLSDIEFSKLFFTMVSAEVQYRPSNGVLDEIISSGKLDIFKNQKLKSLLSSWSGVIYKVRFQEYELSKCRMDIIDLHQELGNARQSINGAYGNLFDITPSKFTTGNIRLLQSEKFENYVVYFLSASRFANENYYSDLDKIINEILKIIDLEIL